MTLSNDDIRILDDLKEYLKTNQKSFKTLMCNEVTTHTDSMTNEIAVCIENNTDNQEAIEKGIQKIGETHFEGLQKKLSFEVNNFLSELYMQFEKQFDYSIANKLGVKRVKSTNVEVGNVSTGGLEFDYTDNTEFNYIDDLGNDLSKVVDAIPKAIEARKTFEHAMFQIFGDEIMKYTKEKAMDGMIKHVVAQGTKHAVGKYAAAIIPVVGPVITGISLVFDAIGIWNSRAQREREQALRDAEIARAKEEARVEAEKMRKIEIMKISGNVSALMLEEMKMLLVEDINNIFIELITKINTQVQDAKQQNDKLTDSIDVLDNIIRECEDYSAMA